MRYFFLAYLLAIVLVVGIAGFRGDKFTHTPIEIFNDMDQQAKVKAQATNGFFADGTGSRRPVIGTVPMGLTIPTIAAAAGGHADYGFSAGADYYNSGRMGDVWGDGFPEQIVINEGLIRLGQERYNINCAICHGEAGDGKGVTSGFGIPNIANFHEPRFTTSTDPAYRPNGWIYDTITNGNRGLMSGYGANIPVKERWAIVAWVRTLQMSRKAPLSEPAIKAAWDASQSSTVTR